MITRAQSITAELFHVRVTGNTKCSNWRRSGMTQTWKTRPNEFRIPVKFGLYTSDAITHTNNESVFVASECPHCNK